MATRFILTKLVFKPSPQLLLNTQSPHLPPMQPKKNNSRVKPLPVTPLKKSIKKIEHGIRDTDIEYMILMDRKTGKVHIDHTDKKSDSVYVSPKKFDKVNKTTGYNTIMTHNHPMVALGEIPVPESFSPDDIFTAISLNLAGVRAVDMFYTYIIKRPKNGWPKITSNGNKFTADLMKILKRVQNHYRREVNEGRLSLVIYERDISHWIAREWAKYLKVPYVRNRNGRRIKMHFNTTELPSWYKPIKKGVKKTLSK